MFKLSNRPCYFLSPRCVFVPKVVMHSWKKTQALMRRVLEKLSTILIYHSKHAEKEKKIYITPRKCASAHAHRRKKAFYRHWSALFVLLLLALTHTLTHRKIQLFQALSRVSFPLLPSVCECSGCHDIPPSPQHHSKSVGKFSFPIPWAFTFNI